MKSAIFSIDIFNDLSYKGRVALAESTKNPEILILLAEDSYQYVRGQVVQNVNTPIYILVKMLEEYDGVSWSLKTEDHYSGYKKENIEKNLTLAQKIRMYSFNTFDDYYNPNSEVMKTTVLGVRVCRTVKNRFFDFCEKEKLPARKVITYLIENFLDKYED